MLAEGDMLPWDERSAGSHATIESSATKVSAASLSSSLPSVVAAAAMEAEDEEEANRLLGQIKEQRQVNVCRI